MTYEQATADLAVTPVEVAEVAAISTKHFRINEDGSRTEISEDDIGFVTDEGSVASPSDVTVH